MSLLLKIAIGGMENGFLTKNENNKKATEKRPELPSQDDQLDDEDVQSQIYYQPANPTQRRNHQRNSQSTPTSSHNL